MMMGLMLLAAVTHVDQPSARRLETDGFTVVPNVLDGTLRHELSEVSERLLNDPSLAHLQRDKFTGSLIPISKDPTFAKLIGHHLTMQAFEGLGFARANIRWMSGFIISKPPHSPSLGWHQDGWFWNDEAAAYGAAPAQLFAMFYLTNTSASNGCLRVLPSTHRAAHPLHRTLRPAHSEAVRSTSKAKEWLASPEHQEQKGGVDVPVRAGDVVIGDARVLHGARPNPSGERRTLITVWYIARFEQQSRAFRDGVGRLHAFQSAEVHEEWPESARNAIKPLLPETAGKHLRQARRRRFLRRLLKKYRWLLGPLLRRGGPNRGPNASTTDDGLYNHNLKFMVRQPGWDGSDPRSAKVWEAVMRRQTGRR